MVMRLRISHLKNDRDLRIESFDAQFAVVIARVEKQAVRSRLQLIFAEQSAATAVSVGASRAKRFPGVAGFQLQSHLETGSGTAAGSVQNVRGDFAHEVCPSPVKSLSRRIRVIRRCCSAAMEISLGASFCKR